MAYGDRKSKLSNGKGAWLSVTILVHDMLVATKKRGFMTEAGAVVFVFTLGICYNAIGIVPQ
jgi:hypothetical protein